jgi:hypothetical protein
VNFRWLLGLRLKTLAVGDHTIHMAGSEVNHAEGMMNNFARKLSYLPDAIVLSVEDNQRSSNYQE